MKLSTPAILLVIAILYLSYHALTGEQGLSQWTDMQSQENDLVEQRDELIAKRDQLRRDIARMNPSTLDLDFLEEQARLKLQFVRADEIVISYPPNEEQLPKNEDLFALSK